MELRYRTVALLSRRGFTLNSLKFRDSCNNLEFIYSTAEQKTTQYTFQNSLYTLRLQVRKFFILKKKMEKRLGVMIEIEIYLTWQLWYLQFCQKSDTLNIHEIFVNL